MPHDQPSPSELQDMSQKAQEIVHLLEDFKRSHLPENERTKIGDPLRGSSEDHRAPKRPWEDMGQDGSANSDQAEDVCYPMSPSVCIETDWLRLSSPLEIKPRLLLSKTCKLFVASVLLAQQGHKILPANQRTSTGRGV